MSSPAAAPLKYRVVLGGAGAEELDRLTIRDYIRDGAIDANTEIAPLGTEDWKKATSYPEFTRYFELAATRNPQQAPKQQRVVQPMAQRIREGLIYPIASSEVITLIAIAVVGAIPIIGFCATLATVAYMLAIIRRSADGSTKMPPIVDTGDIPHLTSLFLKVIFVTLVSLIPLIAWSAFSIPQMARGHMTPGTFAVGTTLMYGLAALYYPACLATMAIWGNALASLSPVYIARFIRTVGTDYLVVIVMWFVATTFATLAYFLSPLRVVPILGGLLSSVISLWALFYVSHLLGYAIYRHSPELGWE